MSDLVPPLCTELHYSKICLQIRIGLDISRDMLDVAREREVEGDLLHGDMGDGVPFRPGCFDGAISISALQWLCNADKSYHKPHKRLFKFFSSLYASLVSNGP